jgi:hypothetical protein
LSVIIPGALIGRVVDLRLIISLILSSIFCEGAQNQPGGAFDSCMDNETQPDKHRTRLWPLDWNSQFFRALCAREQRRAPSARGRLMKNFSDAAFSPEMIEIMSSALEASVVTLPHPVASVHVSLLAESILRTAKTGERDIAVLQRIALLELQITPRV